MARADLLALSPDDLVTLSNRGLVKRAQQEIEAGELTVELTEDAQGTVTARWSDGVECVLPAITPLAEGRCSCPATTLCRHLLRTVLIYQRQASAPVTEETQLEGQVVPITPPEPWDPGGIGDEVLEQVFARTVLARARRQFEEGHVFELARLAKPVARNHTLGVNLRFLVPGDPRYVHCDCGEPAPCSHVPLTVLAFRLLAPERASGLVSTRQTAMPVPTALLDEIERALDELALYGVANVPAPLGDRFRRLEAECRTEGLIWPAEILADLLLQHESYAQHDARFSPVRVVELVGELCARLDAIRHDTGAAPPLFLCGAKSDRVTEIGTARLIGLGCGVEIHRGGVRLSSYMQDMDGGAIVAVRREIPDPEDAATERPSFRQLARAPVFKGASLASLSAGQMLVKGGKRSPNHEFLFGRAPVSVQPQAYQWEALRPPVLAESFREIAARLAALPPPPLRPRRLGEDFHVCPVAAVEMVRFDAAAHALAALLRDSEGGTAMLIHPYTARGQEGFDHLLAQLRSAQEGASVRFVAGPMRLGAAGLMIAPVALVLEQGSVRHLVQPWVDRAEAGERIAALTAELSSNLSAAYDPLGGFRQQVGEAVADLFLTGLQRTDTRAARLWEELSRRGAALGYARLADVVERLSEGLALKQSALHWDGIPTAQALKTLAVYLLLGQDA